jgi:hypothetical protein
VRHIHHKRGLQHKDSLKRAPPGTNLGKNMGDQALAKNNHLPLARRTQGYPYLGQSRKKRFCRALHFLSLLEIFGISKPPSQSLLLQYTNLGSLCLYHAHHGPQTRRPQGNLRTMERLIFSFSHPKPYMAATSELHPLEALERVKHTNISFVSA